MKIIIGFLCVLYIMAYVRGQAANQRPVIRCPNLFSYVRTDAGTVGKITINFIPAGTHRVKVAFSQVSSIESIENAKLTLYHTEEIVQGRLSRGEPISFRVIFPTPDVIPKLTLIALNNRVLCAGTPYPPPSSSFELEDTLSYSNVPNKKVKLNISSAPISSQISTDTTTVRTLPSESEEFPNVSKLWKSLKQAREQEEEKNQPQEPNNNNFECGQEGNLNEDVLVPLILGGENISKGQFPWMAAIKHQDGFGNWVFKCGGTLIGGRAVLTAAHCLHDSIFQPTPILAELGRYNINSESEDEQIVIPTEKILMHPDYRKHSFPDADIGLVLLKETVQFNQYISPICSWSGSDDLNEIVGNMGIVYGWGIDESGVHSPLPKMIAVPVVSELACRQSSPAIFNLYTNRTLCAGRRDGSGPLKGDSGGALMIKRNDRWMLRGIVSVGLTKGQNEEHHYVIYCDVAKYGTWIRNNM